MVEVSLRRALAPLERALLDHHLGRPGGALGVRFDDGRADELDPAWFFRDGDALDRVDRSALARARGRVLDVGAGAGAHALPLVASGHAVTALDVLPGAVRILRERGVADARVGGVLDTALEGRFDTVLLLMNGTGVAGTLAGLPPLLERVGELLAPAGRALIDSTDPGDDDPGDGRHPGEMQIQLEYRGRRGPPFPHLYVGPGTLAEVAGAAGLVTELVDVGEPGGTAPVEQGRFLAELRRP